MATNKFGSLLLLALVLVAQILHSNAGCNPQVTTSTNDPKVLMNPKTTSVTFWSPSDTIMSDVQVQIGTQLPLQLQVLLDTNGLTIESATELVRVMKDTLQSGILFGADVANNWNVSVRVYAEQSAGSGPVLQLGGGSVFNSDVQSVVEAISAIFLLANGGSSTSSPTMAAPAVDPVSTRLLDLAAEIVTGWPASQMSAQSSQVLLIFAPNDFSASQQQWSKFEQAVRSASVLPVFYAPYQSPAWQSSLESAWSSSFPGSAVPAFYGSQTKSGAWNNFDLNPALAFARQLLRSANGAPVFSDSPAVSVIGDSQASADTRDISLRIALDASVTPYMAPNVSTIRVLGMRPVEISTRFSLSPVGANAVATMQSLNVTALTLPVGDNTTHIILKAPLPTQGQLFVSGMPASTGTPVSVDSLTFQPNSWHSSSDSLSYDIVAACGNFGPYTLNLNLTLVPLIPITSDGSITLNEDDLSNHSVNLASLVSQTSSSATITLLSLPTMIGTLKSVSTGLDAQLGVAYPASSAIFNFKLHGRYRGPRVASFAFTLDNGLGATSSSNFTITVSDVQHDPTWSILTTEVTGNNYFLVRDMDNTTVAVSVTSTANLQICQWFENNYSVCVTTNSYSVTAKSPAIFSVGYVTLLGGSATYDIKATDAFSGHDVTRSNLKATAVLLGGLLEGLVGLVVGLLDALLLGGSATFTLVPNVPSGATVNNCFFAGVPTSATLTRDGILGTVDPWAWSTSALNQATYAVFPGVSGYDDFFFQCTYNSNRVSGIQRWNPRIPITTPTASALALTPTPDAPFAFIPFQGLVSEGFLYMTDITHSPGNFTMIAGGIRFISELASGNFAYRLCSTLNSTLCTGIISNTINKITSLPLLGEPAQTFTVRLLGVINTFQIAYPAGPAPDGIIIHGFGPLSTGTVKINGVEIGSAQLGQFWPTTTFTFEFAGQMPITAKLLSMASFTYTLVRDGKQSLPGTVLIYPDVDDLLPLLPPVGTVVGDLVTELTDTLDSVVSTLVPGFRVELDVFGKKERQSAYQRLLEAAAQEGQEGSASLENPSAVGLGLTATINVPRVGRMEICNFGEEICDLVNATLFTQVVVTYNQTVYFTPPLLTALHEVLGLVSWTLNIVDSLGRFVGQTVDGTLELANDVVSDTLRLNVMENASPALKLNVPGIRRLLNGAGLDPDGCGEIPPSPLVCVGGELVANDTVTVDSSTWTITVAQTTVYSGDLVVSPTGKIVMHRVPPSGLSLRKLPYLSVAGDVYLQGELVFALTTLELNSLIFGLDGKRDSMANESVPYTVISGRTVPSGPTVTLETETNCYTVTAAPGNNGRPTLTVTFSFNSDDVTCSGVENPENYSPPGTPGAAVTGPASKSNKWSKNKIIWVSCAAAGGFLLIALFVGLVLLFHFNAAAKRLARPYSIRRHKGQMYRTQPSSEMMNSASQGSTEMLCPEELAGNGAPDPESTPPYQQSPSSYHVGALGTAAAMSAMAASQLGADDYDHDSDTEMDDDRLDDTEDHAMPRSL